SPRNVLGAEKQPQRFGGGEAEGWYAPALDTSSPAPSRWTADRLVEYLRTGLDDSHDAAAGPMVSVVHSLERASDSDVRAIATYVASLGGDSAPRSPPAARESRAGSDGDHELEDGAAIYASTCASCHESGRHATSEAAL